MRSLEDVALLPTRKFPFHTLSFIWWNLQHCFFLVDEMATWLWVVLAWFDLDVHCCDCCGVSVGSSAAPAAAAAAVASAGRMFQPECWDD